MLFTGLARATDSNGKPIAGAQWFFYASGTTTPQAAYADNGLVTPLANPVVADSTGLFPNIYLDPTLVYRCRLTDASGNPLQADIDPLSPAIPAISTFSKGLLGAPDAPTTLTELGFSAFFQTLIGNVDAETVRNTLLAATMENVSDTNLGGVDWRIGTNRLSARWGTAQHPDNTGALFVNFFTPFPHAGFWGICANFTGTSAPPIAFHGNVTPVKTGMQCYSSTSSGVAAPVGTQFNWLALGW